MNVPAKSDPPREAKLHLSDIHKSFGSNRVLRGVDLNIPAGRSVVGSLADRISGSKCSECGEHAVFKVDGCERCSVCGAIGTCG